MGWQRDIVILEKCETKELQAVQTLKSDMGKKFDLCVLYNADLIPHPTTIAHALQVTFVVMTSLIGCK